MFKLDPEIMPKYPFYQDEWNKISFADYSGQYPDQPPHTWFVVFRLVSLLSHLYSHLHFEYTVEPHISGHLRSQTDSSDN